MAKKTTPRNPNTCREEYFPGVYSLPGQVAKGQLRERRFPAPGEGFSPLRRIGRRIPHPGEMLGVALLAEPLWEGSSRAPGTGYME